MRITSVIFENGLTADHHDGRWLVRWSDRGERFGGLREVFDELSPSRPILFHSGRPEDKAVPLIHSAKQSGWYELGVQEIFWCRTNDAAVPALRDLHHVLSASNYHLRRLALEYSVVGDFLGRYAVTARNLSAPSTFSGNPDLYFELEALILAARRVYMALGGAIWSRYGKKKTRPRGDFPVFVAAAPRLPDALRDRLQLSWSTWGARLKSYRDCLSHHTTIAPTLGHVMVERHSSGGIAIQAKLPDNPEVRALERFTYRRELNVLSYAYDLAEDLLEVSGAVVKGEPS